MTDDRLTRLETLLSHQEKQIEDLSEVLRGQAKEIQTLSLRLDRTQKKLMEYESSGGESAGESLSVTEQAARDKPPHY